jgi:hypothetical protein
MHGRRWTEIKQKHSLFDSLLVNAAGMATIPANVVLKLQTRSKNLEP